MSQLDYRRQYYPPRQHRWTREYYLAALAIIVIALISWTVAAKVPMESKQTTAGNVRYHARQIEEGLK